MSFENWMANLPKEATICGLNNIAIPGSHDSFTFNLQSDHDIGPDARPAFLKLFSIFGKFAKIFMKSWLITQNDSVSDQLNSGIRYFDVRIGKFGDCFYVTHQLFCGDINEILKTINTFLVKHPKEVVFLDFNHVYLCTGDHECFQGSILSIFNDKIATPEHYNGNMPSLKEMWNNSHQVMLFYHGNCEISRKFWSGEFIPTFWPNTVDTKEMIIFLQNAIRVKSKSKFHICQGILTPTASTICLHPCSSLQTHLALKANSKLVEWINDLSLIEIERINIVIADFVTSNQFIESIIQLNYKKKFIDSIS